VKRPVSLLGGKLKMILKNLDGEAWNGLQIWGKDSQVNTQLILWIFILLKVTR
jgi:hypothetical protein